MMLEFLPWIPDSTDQFARYAVTLVASQVEAQVGACFERRSSLDLLFQRCVIEVFADFLRTRVQTLLQHTSIESAGSHAIDVDTRWSQFFGQRLSESHQSRF